MQPVIALASDSDGAVCCDSGCGEGDEQTQDDCESCNPFQACGCCLGFTVKTIVYKIEQPSVNTFVTVLFKENITSQFSPDVWQPPKIS